MATIAEIRLETFEGKKLNFYPARIYPDKPAKPNADGSIPIWHNAWIRTDDGTVYCVGATEDTLLKIAGNIELDTLGVSKFVDRKGTKVPEYKFCQLVAHNTSFSF
jgi:hypothetical protein